jgi:hypothetical protein
VPFGFAIPKRRWTQNAGESIFTGIVMQTNQLQPAAAEFPMENRAGNSAPVGADKFPWRLALLFCLLACSLPAATFNVLDYGARGDGATLDTAAIQRAIDAAAARGGTVLIPRRHTFLVATLHLQGGIDFHLEGTLLISTNQADYSGDGVLLADQAANLKITGGGRILGQSLSFMTGYDAPNEWWLFQEWRPKMFVLTGCTNLIVRDITFGDAPFWGLHLLGCENVLVDNVTVQNRLDVPNDDGIDPDHCRHVEIKRCHITCGDDAVVIKSTRQTNDFGASAGIHVHDCVIRTQDAGLKIGTETTGDIHDILFERCKILSSSRGLCIQLRDEGSISNVVFRNIELVSRYHSDPWWGRGEAISFTVIPRTAATKLGRLQAVLVENVLGRAENSVRINGSPRSQIENVRLENVSVRLGRWTKYPGGVYDNRPTKAVTPLETHGADGFNLRQVKGAVMVDCAVSWTGGLPAGAQPAVVAEDATELQIEGFVGDSAAHPICVK